MKQNKKNRIKTIIIVKLFAPFANELTLIDKHYIENQASKNNILGTQKTFISIQQH